MATNQGLWYSDNSEENAQITEWAFTSDVMSDTEEIEVSRRQARERNRVAKSIDELRQYKYKEEKKLSIQELNDMYFEKDKKESKK